MQKTKKHFLGMVGLALVALLTLVAYGLPSPEASAAEEGNVDVQVVVGEPNMNNRINAPRDGDIVVKPDLEISSSYSQASKIEYFLTYSNADGQEVRVPVGSFTPTENSGVNTFTVNLDGYGGFNNYRLTSVAYGNNGAQREDTVAFAYRAINVYYNGLNDNEDPQLKAEVNEKVDKIQVQVYDKDNNPVFVDENGVEHPIIVDKSAIDPETGELLIDLPFKEYGVPEGDYRAVVVTYDENDVILSIDTVPFTYKLRGSTPEVPNTGSMLENLNISRLDYLLTGLIAFGAVAGFAIYLICRKNRR